MMHDDGLIKDEDKDVENSKLSVVTRGNSDPEEDFNSLVEFLLDIQIHYQNKITETSLVHFPYLTKRIFAFLRVWSSLPPVVAATSSILLFSCVPALQNCT